MVGYPECRFEGTCRGHRGPRLWNPPAFSPGLFCLAVVSDISPGLKLYTVWIRWRAALRPLKMDSQGTPGTQAGLLSTELGHPSPCVWKTR